MQAYLIKSIASVLAEGQPIITNIDVPNRVVEGYFSVFGNIDADGDMIVPGAFSKTLKEKRQRHLYQHDVRYPVARPELKEDSVGLWFHSNISDTTVGRDLMKLYDDGVIDEHSIGFNTIKQQKKSNYNEITEMRLWEGSSVTWGANSMALGGPIKSMNKEDITSRMDIIYKALRNGKYETDEIFDMLDIYHQQLKQIIINLNAPVITSAAEAVAQKPNHTELYEIMKRINNIDNTFNLK